MTPSSFDKATVVDPIVDSNWDSSVLAFADYSIFHSSAWARVLHKTYGHRPLYQRCWRGGKAVALLPLMEVKSRLTGRRGVSLPFSDFCEPLLAEASECEPLLSLLGEVAKERRWSYFELRGGSREFENRRPSSQFHGHELDLRPKLEALFASFSGPVRRAIGKAGRSGLKVEILRTKAGLLAFYKLHLQTRRQFGIPPQSLGFFLHIYEELIKPGLGVIVLAFSGAQPVAAAVFFQFGKKALYKFGASDRRFQELRGNNLVMWKAIEFFAAENTECFHFGRTSVNNEGLRRFKLAWASKEKLISYFKFNAKNADWVAGRDHSSGFHQSLFRHLPVTLNRLAGALLYPHLD